MPRLGAALALVLSLLACDPDASQPAIQPDLVETDGLCRLVFEPTGLTLESDLEGSIPDPVANAAALDGEGRFYTRTSAPGVVARWTPEGEFDAAVGAPGEGPQEFDPIVRMYLGAGDTIHVLHRARWSMIAPDLSVHFVARVDALAGPAVQGSEISVDGRLMLPMLHPEQGVYGVGIIDREGELAHFVEAPDADPMIWEMGVGIARIEGSNEFWVGPTQHDQDHYVLERWSPEGERLERIERRIDWIPDEALPIPRQPVSMWLHRHPGSAISVSAMVPIPSLDQGAFENMPSMTRTFHRLEVLDPGSGELLVSAWVDLHPEAVGTVGTRLRGTAKSLLGTRRDDGVEGLEVGRFELHPRTPEAAELCGVSS
ncbi:MAG: hypothetical protein EA351_07325 [Gemmatimonadales bacterium]|nr:MAG: hypothetical protein EA351_07325 [Gemmatimonadales bacterium]